MTKVIKTSLPTKNWINAVPVRIVVPSTIDNTNGTPVLYLLHGLFGGCDNWIELTDLVERMRDRQYVVVTPEAYDSWYVNSATDDARRYEDFFLGDLIPWVDEQFSKAGQRAVAGLSMGGYGAVKFSVKRPDLFEFAWSSSGAFSGPRTYRDAAGFEELKDSVESAFGDRHSPSRSENDVFELIERVSDEKLPKMFLDCGEEDEFLAVNREFETAAKKARIKLSYREQTGGHDWEYWGKRLIELLATADGYFK